MDDNAKERLQTRDKRLKQPFSAFPGSVLPGSAERIPPSSDVQEAGSHLLEAGYLALYEVERELCGIRDLDTLCRRAIALAVSRLAFERISLWFFTDEPHVLSGTFGVDVQGQVCDERSARMHERSETFTHHFLERQLPLLRRDDQPLHDTQQRLVGRGTSLTAPIWDRDRLIGLVFADNLLSHAAITPAQQNLLMVYATILSHLCSRLHAEATLREAEQRLWRLLETVQMIAVLLDRDGKITFVNDYFLNLTDSRNEQVVGRNWFDLFIPIAERAELESAFRRRIAEGSVLPHRENAILTRSGSTRLIDWNNALLRDAQGSVIGSASLGVDVTDSRLEAERSQQRLFALQRSVLGTVNAMSVAVERRDPYTAGHQRRVSALACAIAAFMGISGEKLETLRIAGLLHDMGKIAVPAEILGKPTRLTSAEFAIVQTHTQIGYDIFRATSLPPEVAQVALQHHERLDGSGYPHGLRNAEIIFEAKLIAVADLVEAMASHRPYRPALTLETALSEIRSGSGRLYEPDIVDAACAVLSRQGLEVLVSGAA